MTVRVDVHFTDAAAHEVLREEVRRGLTATPKWLLPKWFYDARGSELFEKITYLPEYYPSRREREILGARAADIIAAAGNSTLVELGSGVSEKTRLLLDAMRAVGKLERYVPFDVCEPVIRDVAASLSQAYPEMEIHGVVGDFERHRGAIPRDGSRLISMLGGTIGNLGPMKRGAFYRDIAAQMSPEDSFLLGTDLIKDPARLHAAYNDAQGVTAEFNENILLVLNRELGADFDVSAWKHLAVYDVPAHRIEMYLVSQRAQTVRLPAIDLTVEIEAGEQLRTEISTKFTRAMVEEELSAAGLRLVEWWSDPDGDYALSLSRRLPPSPA